MREILHLLRTSPHIALSVYLARSTRAGAALTVSLASLALGNVEQQQSGTAMATAQRTQFVGLNAGLAGGCCHQNSIHHLGFSIITTSSLLSAFVFSNSDPRKARLSEHSERLSEQCSSQDNHPTHHPNNTADIGNDKTQYYFIPFPAPWADVPNAAIAHNL